MGSLVHQLQEEVHEEGVTIGILEDQLHDLQLKLHDANEHIEMPHEQQVAIEMEEHQDVDIAEEEEDLEEIEGVSSLDKESLYRFLPTRGPPYPEFSAASVNWRVCSGK